MELQITGRNGALTEYRIVGGAQHIDDMPELGYSYRADGDDVAGRGSKRDIARLREWVHATNLAAAKSENPAVNKSAPGRVLIAAGTRHVGDKINGFVITGLGAPWSPNADTYSAHGIDPAADYVQYAYFN